ncbi:hypothetical protein Cni_G28913 [Canna indica]|uniref:Uncharacterized protein n=1 Tax=Canna indica TaxID=4628 RepID=A0AAQ3L862_9LILI|nr:hypothetical protein Cni_G28913 [Canna indica]
MGNKFWQALASENISKLCYTYGKIDHSHEQCNVTVIPNETVQGKSPVVRPDSNPNAEQFPSSSSQSHSSFTETSKDNLYGPWMVVNRRKKSVGKRATPPEFRTSNDFNSITDNGVEKMKIEAANMKNSLGNETKVVKENFVKNPFATKKAQIPQSDSQIMDVEEFNAPKLNCIPVQVNFEKNVEALHKKLSNTFVIAVNKVIENESSQHEGANIDFNFHEGKKDSRIRKFVNQTIHLSNFPLDLKQNKAKKKRFSKDLSVVSSDGDPNTGQKVTTSSLI